MKLCTSNIINELTMSVFFVIIMHIRFAGGYTHEKQTFRYKAEKSDGNVAYSGAVGIR